MLAASFPGHRLALLSAPMPISPGLVCEGLALGAGAGPISSRVSLPGEPPPPAPAGESTGSVVVGVVATGAILALALGVGAIYNQWAYGDWTCLLKSCTQTSQKRR